MAKLNLEEMSEKQLKKAVKKGEITKKQMKKELASRDNTTGEKEVGESYIGGSSLSVLKKGSFKGQNIIKSVLMSFPSIEKTELLKDGTDTGKFATQLLISKKDKDTINAIKNIIVAGADENFESTKKLNTTDLFEDLAEITDHEDGSKYYRMKLSNRRKPTVIGLNSDVLTDAEIANEIYSGAIVDVIFNFWYQDNDYGKAIRGNLNAIKVVALGKRLGGGSVEAKSDDFE